MTIIRQNRLQRITTLHRLTDVDVDQDREEMGHDEGETKEVFFLLATF